MTRGAPLRALLALLGLWPGLWPSPGLALAPRARPPAPDARGDLDSVINLAKALLGETKALLELLQSRFPAEGEHKLDSLPVLAMSALELPSLQAAALLPRLGSDLLRYQRLLEWLRRAGAALRGLDPHLAALRGRLERLRGRLEHLVSPWGAVRAAHALLRGLHLYLDWAARGLVLLRNRL